MKQHLKGNIYIGYSAGFITVHQKTVKGDKSKNEGEEGFAPALTYSNADYVVRNLIQRFDVHVSRSQVLEAYKAAKREYLIESAKAGKVKSAAMKAKATGQIN